MILVTVLFVFVYIGCELMKSFFSLISSAAPMNNNILDERRMTSHRKCFDILAFQLINYAITGIACVTPVICYWMETSSFVIWNKLPKQEVDQFSVWITAVTWWSQRRNEDDKKVRKRNKTTKNILLIETKIIIWILIQF